ncbi:MAG: hypothetical protein ACI9F9_000650 [Candidatus Paceibacteria bacterium]|jgi:hypothetical protein
MKQANHQVPYCLHCYATLDSLTPPSTHCPECNRINLAVDLKRLWTKERKVRDIEQILKALIVVFLGALSGYILLNSGVGLSGHGHGMAVGAPIVLGILLWDAASITQKTSVFKGSLIWPIVGGLLLWPACTIALGTTQLGPRLIASAVSLACAFGLLSPLLRPRWLAWRGQRVLTLGGQSG